MTDGAAGAGGDVKVGGKPLPKKWVWIGVAAAGGFVLWRYYQASQAPAVATPIDAELGTESINGDQSVGAGGVVGNVQYAGTVQAGDASITTNSAWTQAAVDYLSNTAGYGAGAVTDALGSYLAGNALTDSQVTIVRSALAAVGSPPQGTYTIKHAVTQTAPNPSEQIPAAPMNLRAVTVQRNQIRVEWDPVPGATHYMGSMDGGHWKQLSGAAFSMVHLYEPGGPAFKSQEKVRVMVRAANARGFGPITDTVVTVP